MPLPIGRAMPTLEGATAWIVAPANEFAGYPVLVQFWAVSCPACKFNMPRFLELGRIYEKHGLLLISIHTPRGESDRNVEQVRATAEEIGITGPCAIDNENAIADCFEMGGIWPSYFFFDGEGRLRSRAAGATGLKIAENSLKRLLALPPADTDKPTLSEAKAA